MRFSYPCLPGEFEIPDDWLQEAGMIGFTAAASAYNSADLAQLIPLRKIEPPFRFPEHPKDWRGFDRGRMVCVLQGIASRTAIKPVPLIELPFPEFVPVPFGYRVCDGLHRFYASVAAGFSLLPATVQPWPD